MINYETFCKIHDCHHRQGLTIAQTARLLGLHPRTVATWLARARFTAGVANYLDVVNAEQNLYSGELALASAIGAQFTAAADLYRALGGGWKMPPPPAPSAKAPVKQVAARR